MDKDKYGPQRKYKKKNNITKITFDVPNAEAQAFNEACQKLGLKKATIFRRFMRSIVGQAQQEAQVEEQEA